jgi:hypothetical protein
LPVPRWRGEPLAGKKLYLWAEQGLGDLMMFAGFLPHLLSQNPARIVLGVYPRLISIMARSFPEITVEPLENAILHALAPAALACFPAQEKQAAHMGVNVDLLRKAYEYTSAHGLFDYAAPMGDLLVYCMPGYRAANHAGYILPDAARTCAIKNAAGGQGRRIGISWFTTNEFETTRSIPLAQWLPLLARKECHFVSLQHGVTGEVLAQFCREHPCTISVPDFDVLRDTDGLAALIASLDEVVTIDNSIAHMAGAMGVKTTLLLPKGHNFRWPEKGDGTLWYASVRVVRQKKAGEWETVMEEVAKSA